MVSMLSVLGILVLGLSQVSYDLGSRALQLRTALPLAAMFNLLVLWCYPFQGPFMKRLPSCHFSVFFSKLVSKISLLPNHRIIWQPGV